MIPGLISWDAGLPLAATAARAKGYDMGVVLVLENEAQFASFARHPAHHEYVLCCLQGVGADRLTGARVHNMRQTLCEDTLVFDFNF
jgi:hypothetical protein